MLLAACGGNAEDETPEPASPTGSASPTETAVPTEASQEETNGNTAAIGEPFTLEPGQSMALETAGLTITFDMVITDVRCPTEVDCFQNGPVIVQISAEAADGSSSTFEMNPSPELAALQGNPPKIVTFQEYEIELTAVDPYPAVPEDIMNMDYTATLIVRPLN